MTKAEWIPQDEIVTDIATLKQRSRETTTTEIEDLKLEECIRKALPGSWTPGFGLAAIQIGVPLQFAFYSIPDPEDKEHKKCIERRLINAEILKGKHQCITKEGCLSLPGQWYTVSRFSEIIYITDGGTGPMERSITVPGVGTAFYAFGIEAQIIQHEIDHFNGILAFSRAVRPTGPKIGRN